LEWREFHILLVLLFFLHATVDVWLFWMIVLCLQWQIISQINNGVMKVEKRMSLFNSCELSALNIKMNRSKSIREERNCLTQILFGTMDPPICPQLKIVASLEGGGLQFILVWQSPF
jgi:hypothetical protein